MEGTRQDHFYYQFASVDSAWCFSLPLLLFILEGTGKGKQDGDDSAIGSEHDWPSHLRPSCWARLIALEESVPTE